MVGKITMNKSQIVKDLIDSVGFILCLVLIIMGWAWLESCYA